MLNKRKLKKTFLQSGTATFVFVAQQFVARTLTTLLQNGLELTSCRTVEGVDQGKKLPEPILQLLWDQDLADGFVEPGDRVGFFSNPLGGNVIIILKVTGVGACRTVTRLCGHGDVNVNARQNFVALRRGKTRVQCGVRCVSSARGAVVAAKIFAAEAGGRGGGGEVVLPPRLFVRVPDAHSLATVLELVEGSERVAVTSVGEVGGTGSFAVRASPISPQAEVALGKGRFQISSTRETKAQEMDALFQGC